jgi:hypothetical protein
MKKHLALAIWFNFYHLVKKRLRQRGNSNSFRWNSSELDTDVDYVLDLDTLKEYRQAEMTLQMLWTRRCCWKTARSLCKLTSHWKHESRNERRVKTPKKRITERLKARIDWNETSLRLVLFWTCPTSTNVTAGQAVALQSLFLKKKHKGFTLPSFPYAHFKTILFLLINTNFINKRTNTNYIDPILTSMFDRINQQKTVLTYDKL